MKNHDAPRRYPARMSRIGIIAAILYALLYAVVSFISIYGFRFRFSLLTIGRYNVMPELAVVAVGVLALLVCGILSLVLREKPAVAQAAWILGGKAVLLAAPVGYIRSQLLVLGMTLTSSPQLDFLFSFATLATVFVGYAWSMRPREGLTEDTHGVRPRRILRGTAIVGGIMLVSVLWLLLMQWKSNSSLMEYWSADQKLEYLLWTPLNAAAPVAIAVTVGYPLLSFASWLDTSPRKGRFGKGTILLGWVTLGANTLRGVISCLIQHKLLQYTPSAVTGGLGWLQELQGFLLILSTVTALLGIRTLCHVLADTKESKAVLWGARGVLAVVALRYLSDWVVDTVAIIAQTNKESSGMGIIGGADVSVTLLMARVNSWLSMIFTLLAVVALCILTVGLTRRYRVSKAFWAVPILTAASILLPTAVQILWELLLRHTQVSTQPTWFSMVSVAILPAVLIIARSLVGLLTLTRAPAEEVPPPPAVSESEETPRPQVEDYLYQL